MVCPTGLQMCVKAFFLFPIESGDLCNPTLPCRPGAQTIADARYLVHWKNESAWHGERAGSCCHAVRQPMVHGEAGKARETKNRTQVDGPDDMMNIYPMDQTLAREPSALLADAL